jgi:hypothetical protein
MAKALTFTFINSNPFTHVEALGSPLRNRWNRAMDEECTSVVLNNTFTSVTSREARQLRVMLIGSKSVYMTKHNPDRSVLYVLVQSRRMSLRGETGPFTESHPQ